MYFSKVNGVTEGVVAIRGEVGRRCGDRGGGDGPEVERVEHCAEFDRRSLCVI